MKILRIARLALLCVAGAGCMLGAQAQSALPQTVKIVVPYSPGGVTDLLARYLADQLRQSLDRTVVVDNRPGASGQIGAKVVADAAPNGGTLLLHTAAWPASKVLFKSPLVAVPHGLEPIALLTDEVYVLAGSTGAPFKTFPDMVSYARSHPDKLNYASGGLGDTYLIFESFKKENALSMVSIEYKGASPSLAALIANEVQLGYQPLTVATSYEKAGKMNILAVSGSKRQARYPAVPTFEEVGVKNARNRWYALYAPPKTPKDIVNRLNADITAILARPETRLKLAELSMEPRASTPEQLNQLVLDSLQEFTQMTKVIGYQPQ